MQWPHGRNGDMNWGSELLQRLQEVRAICKTRNQLILIFSDPHCDACKALLPELDRWQSDYANALTIALISRSTRDTNHVKSAQHGLIQVLLQQDHEVAR